MSTLILNKRSYAGQDFNPFIQSSLLISILSLTWGQTTETTKPPYVSVTTTPSPSPPATTTTTATTPETTTTDLGPRFY